MEWSDLASLVTILLGTIAINVYLFKGHEGKVDKSLKDFGDKLDGVIKKIDKSDSKHENQNIRTDALYEAMLKYLNR